MIPSPGVNPEFLSRLKSDFPDLRFIVGKKFAFRSKKIIVIGPEERGDFLILHEIGHALLGHRYFDTDVERVKMEAEAWEKAKDLACIYGVEIDEELIQTELDSYRDWLHKKSRCPKCGLTRFQTLNGVYHCPSCEQK